MMDTTPSATAKTATPIFERLVRDCSSTVPPVISNEDRRIACSRNVPNRIPSGGGSVKQSRGQRLPKLIVQDDGVRIGLNGCQSLVPSLPVFRTHSRPVDDFADDAQRLVGSV